MVKPNYNFAKRQRELAKKAKKEEKQQRKAAEGNAAETDAAQTETDAGIGIAPPSETSGSMP
ncbi:MAG: hypothetical protein WCL29_02300 [Pseudomonadota bacterium]